MDSFRIIATATDDILQTLDAFGLKWDGPILFQSQHLNKYQSALDELQRQDLLYPCTCSRKWLKRNSKSGPNGPIYPGICRNKQNPRNQPHAVRISTCGAQIKFHDLLQGHVQLQLDNQDGDFIVRRRDGIFAYQLAAAVDEHQQNITEVLRGTDLLSSTPRQIFLQQKLNFPTPTYGHVPILVDKYGIKLSKQTGAKPVSIKNASAILSDILTLLKHPPPKEMSGAPPDELLSWGSANWKLSNLIKIESISTME